MHSTVRLSLSASDRARLTAVARTLASPLAYGTADEWRRAATREAKALLGADKASFLLPTADVTASGAVGQVAAAGASLFSDDVPEEDRSAYPAVIQPLDETWSVWRRQVQAGAWTRERLWHPWNEEYLQSAYYNEYIVPGRYFDAVGLTCHLDHPSVAPGPSTVAGLWLHHDRRSGRVFGDRGLAILQLLLPAFVAGAEALHRLGRHRAALVRTLDALGLALLVIDADGRAVHRTPALVQLLAADPDHVQIVGQMAEVAGTVARLAAQDSRAGSAHRRGDTPVDAALSREVRTRSGRYRLRGTLTTPELLGSRPAALVALERIAPEPLSDEALRQRYGLTLAQVRVARLVSERSPIARIAVTLGISVHTARRHVEAIREKIGVTSAVDVAAVVLGHRGFLP